MPAFIVHGDECADVVFCPDQEAAELRVENGHYLDMEAVEPAPQYDQFEPKRRVPKSVLLLDGWWFECARCYCQIDDSTHQPIESGRLLYCSEGCFNADRITAQEER